MGVWTIGQVIASEQAKQGMDDMDDMEAIREHRIKVCAMLAPFTDKTVAELNGLSDDTLLGLASMIQETLQHQPKPIDRFEYNGQMYHAPKSVSFGSKLIRMGECTFGQWMEAMEHDKEGIAGVPYVVQTIFGGGDENMPYTLALDAYAYWVEYRQSLYDKYLKALDVDYMKKEDIEKLKKAGSGMFDGFGYYNWLREASSDITHDDRVEGMRAVNVLVRIAHKRITDRFNYQYANLASKNIF